MAESQPRIPTAPVGGVTPVASVPSCAAPVGSGRDAADIGRGRPPVMPCTGAPDAAVVPANVMAVLVLIVARLPPVSSASADVLRFVPALAVTEPPVACIGEPSVVLIVVRPAKVAAPVGSGRDAAETGCVVALASVRTAPAVVSEIGSVWPVV